MLIISSEKEHHTYAQKIEEHIGFVYVTGRIETVGIVLYCRIGKVQKHVVIGIYDIAANADS